MARPESSWAYAEHRDPLAFAHRGGAAEAPENSWAAFEHAVATGFTYMETDARACADGRAVALHDPDFGRVCGRPGRPGTVRSGELSGYPLADGRPPPLIEDLLGSWPSLCWNIDIKEEAALLPVVEAVRRIASQDRVMLASYSGRRAARASAALGGKVPVAAGWWGVVALLAGRRIGRLPRGWSRATAAQVPERHGHTTVVDEGFVRSCHQAGVAVHVWTVDDPASMHRLLDLGVDGLMTDRPSVLREVLTERGRWRPS